MKAIILSILMFISINVFSQGTITGTLVTSRVIVGDTVIYFPQDLTYNDYVWNLTIVFTGNNGTTGTIIPQWSRTPTGTYFNYANMTAYTFASAASSTAFEDDMLSGNFIALKYQKGNATRIIMTISYTFKPKPIPTIQ